MNKSRFEKAFLEKVEKGLIDDAMDMVNAGWRETRYGTPSELMQNRFKKQTRNADEQQKIDEEIRKFQTMLEAGGIDQAMDILNKGFRDARKKEGETRQRVYGQ